MTDFKYSKDIAMLQMQVLKNKSDYLNKDFGKLQSNE